MSASRLKILIDMQGAQTASRSRGIGRYSQNLLDALLLDQRHEIHILLNGGFCDSTSFFLNKYVSLKRKGNIHVWFPPFQVSSSRIQTEFQRNSAAAIKKNIVLGLRPDIYHQMSLFEGYGEPAVTDLVLGEGLFNTAICFDLIPLLNPDSYLQGNSKYNQFYNERLEHFKRLDGYLAISDYSKSEAVMALGLDQAKITNISTSVDGGFVDFNPDPSELNHLKQTYGIKNEYVFYVGGFDSRKNVEFLIRVFSKLDPALKEGLQLVVAGKVNDVQLASLEKVSQDNGGLPNEIVFVGHIDDSVLREIYSGAKLLVFPSLHEGFGLPVLEAMYLDVPVICSSVTSLPEVLGNIDATFDPRDEDSLSSLMSKCLLDDSFRFGLIEKSRKKRLEFSWDNSAKKAFSFWESLVTNVQARDKIEAPVVVQKKKPLAFVTPLPMQKTGIAEYSVKLGPYLEDHYQIYFIVEDISQISDHVRNSFKVYDSNWFLNNRKKFERVVYHFGNSFFHDYMLDLILQVEGVVVLHDFYLSNLMSWREDVKKTDRAWTRELLSSAGYASLVLRNQNHQKAKIQFPVNATVCDRALGLITHSEYCKSLIISNNLVESPEVVRVVPHAREITSNLSRLEARKILNFSDSDFVVVSFGFLDPVKLNHILLNAFLDADIHLQGKAHLVFVGENEGGEFGRALVSQIEGSVFGKNIKISGFVSSEIYNTYLVAADCAVQLRSSSRGETSGAVMDCLAYGLPLIINSNGSFAEVPDSCAIKLPDLFSVSDLIKEIESLYSNLSLRRKLSESAKRFSLETLSPNSCAKKYYDSIEFFYSNISEKKKCESEIASFVDTSTSDHDLAVVSNSFSATFPALRPKNILFVDISGTISSGLKTGIERVALSLLDSWVNRLDTDFIVIPVHLKHTSDGWWYFFVHDFILNRLDLDPTLFDLNRPIEPRKGDIILGADISLDVIGAIENGLIDRLRARGVLFYQIVFDILPITIPSVFPPGADNHHKKWLTAISHGDGVFCISQDVALEFKKWLSFEFEKKQVVKDFRFEYFNLGANLELSQENNALSKYENEFLESIKSSDILLMVGTIEPRKGYLQTLRIFDELWKLGRKEVLIIIGREGWKGLPRDSRRNIPETIDYLKNHKEYGKKLHWLDNASDALLRELYQRSRCLIAASYGEGFGLPLVEASCYGLPVFARDIPVFREVASRNTVFFKNSNSSNELVDEFSVFLDGLNALKRSVSESTRIMTWKDSAELLMKMLRQ